MLEKLRSRKKLQLVIGTLIGFCFGFLLQRGGVTRYDVIMGQLLLYDWTVAKIILSAIATGMLGVYYMKKRGLAHLHIKAGSVGATVVGGLIFGAGFGILGYCPGTMAGAVGQGSLDALLGGVLGMLLGAGLYAQIYPVLSKSILKAGDFGELTFPDLFRKRNTWTVVCCFFLGILLFLVVLETAGL